MNGTYVPAALIGAGLGTAFSTGAPVTPARAVLLVALALGIAYAAELVNLAGRVQSVLEVIA